jgi:hypothetical protein
LFFSHIGPGETLRKSVYEGKFAPTEEELDRKALMSVTPKKRGAAIGKLMEESKEPRSY